MKNGDGMETRVITWGQRQISKVNSRRKCRLVQRPRLPVLCSMCTPGQGCQIRSARLRASHLISDNNPLSQVHKLNSHLTKPLITIRLKFQKLSSSKIIVQWAHEIIWPSLLTLFVAAKLPLITGCSTDTLQGFLLQLCQLTHTQNNLPRAIHMLAGCNGVRQKYIFSPQRRSL